MESQSVDYTLENTSKSRHCSSSSSSSITTCSNSFSSIDNHQFHHPLLFSLPPFKIPIYVNNNYKQIAQAPNSLLQDQLLSPASSSTLD
uniref:Uncharacterized protein n=1 Tax=Lepeophtheirus salmonis TaxID=72036 RepID=A0A0K2USV4_LEPSM